MPPNVLPIDLTALAGIFFGSLMVLIPIAGVTARFAMKPIVESLARLRESGAKNEAVDMLERRMALLEQEVQAITGMREDVSRLIEELEFQRKLVAPDPARRTGE
ncbi:MAG: hypothetical protein ACREL7_03675 [Longimicrobiales bacterium]